MRKKNTIRTLSLLMLLLAGSVGLAQQGNPDSSSTQLARDSSTENDETGSHEKAIQTATANYIEYFNAGKIDQLAGLWTEKGVYVTQPSGDKVEGREALKKQMTEMHNEDPKRKITIDTQAIELISPSVVLQRGVANVTTGEGEVISSEFRAIFIQQDGKWLLDRVTEDEAEPEKPSHYEQLKPLEFMLGSWSVDSGDGTIKVESGWTANQNFITRAFAIYDGEGVVEGSGMEVIGWDSKRNQIRSWLFDSDGGIVESQWTQKKDRWIVQSVATLPGGVTGSYTSVYRQLEDGKVGWQKINQQVDGELLPNLDEIVVTKE